MTPLWTHKEAVQATGGTSTAYWSARGVSIDSRSVNKGDLFIAIKGPNADGHDYVPAAINAGAAAAMVSEHRKSWPKDAPLLLVGDTDAALNALGRCARKRLSDGARIIGITGSVGKTGTKECLAHALAKQGRTTATKGNLNNQWGLPLSLSRMPADTEYGVFELGMNHAGEISALSKILQPDIAIITTIEPAHTKFFNSVDDIADAKSEIFDGMKPDGIVILNRDNRYFDRLEGRAAEASLSQVISFGAHEAADARLIECSLHASSSTIEANICGKILNYRMGAPGRHWALNSLAVLAAVSAGGADLAGAAHSLADIRPMKGRGERQQIQYAGGAFTLIDESYNASPASMHAAIQVLEKSLPNEGGRRVAVLGDMLELGKDAARIHASLADAICASGIDVVITAGTHMAALSEALPRTGTTIHGATSDDILPIVIATIRPGDVVTVKGSLGSRMTPITEALAALDGTHNPLERSAANGY